MQASRIATKVLTLGEFGNALTGRTRTVSKRTTTSKHSTRREASKKTKLRFPPGWNERKVRAVIEHYDRLTDEELAREIETAQEVTEETLISVPTELLPTIQQLIVRHQQSA
jgi:hypothetical protein